MRKENSISCVHVLCKTLNWVISCCCFAENGKKIYQKKLLFSDILVAVAVPRRTSLKKVMTCWSLP